MNLTKEHIILTSFRLFLQKGYKGVTMNMLVKATGLSKGAFYHYFENKMQLFVETLDGLLFSILPYNYEGGINSELSLYDHMRIYLDNVKKVSEKLAGYLGSEDAGIGYHRLMLDIIHYAPDYHEKIEQSSNNELNFWRKAIKNGVLKNEIKDGINLETLANHFQWVQDGIVINSIFSGNPGVLYKNIEKAFEQLYYFIKK